MGNPSGGRRLAVAALGLAALAGACQPGPNGDLVAAAANGDVAKVRAALAAKADPNASALGEPALCFAAIRGHLDVVRALIAAHADPNLPDSESGQTPLMMAAGYFPKVVSALIAAGANVNARDKLEGQTALGDAASEGQLDSVRALVAAGADVNSPRDEPPLMWATRSGKLEVVRLLLDHGADPNGTQVLETAVYRHRDDIARLLRGRGAR